MRKAKINKVLICIPNMGSINTATTQLLIAWAKKYPTQLGFFFPTEMSPVDRARNFCVEYFLKEDYTHLFFIDSDTVPPPDALEKLLSHGKLIVTGITPLVASKRGLTWIRGLNVFKGGKPIVPDGKLQEVDTCGASCLLIARKVFERLQTPPFRFMYDPKHTGLLKGEDWYFCELARGKEFKIYCDTSIEAAHYKNVTV